MVSVYRVIWNTVSSIPLSTAGGMFACAAGTGVILHYSLPERARGLLSDLVVIEKTSDAAKLGIGKLISENLGTKPGVKFIAQTIAMVGVPFRLIEQTNKVDKACGALVNEVHDKYSRFYLQDIKNKKEYRKYYISPSIDLSLSIAGRRWANHALNIIRRLGELLWAVVGQGVILNDLVSTLAWTEGAQVRNVDHVICNFCKIISFLASKDELWRGFVKNNKQTVELSLKAMNRDITAEKFIENVDTAMPPIRALNYSIENSGSYVFRGISYLTETTGLNYLFGWERKTAVLEEKKTAELPGSPFKEQIKTKITARQLTYETD